MRMQQGFVMLELIVAAIVTTLVAVWATNTLVNKINDAQAQAGAVWMMSVKKSVHDYIGRYADALIQADDAGELNAKGYADWAAPTINELKADGLLTPGFPETVAAAGSAAVRLMRHGSCPGLSCRLEAIVYSTIPFRVSSGQQVNEQMVAQWLMAAQGWGGSVSTSQPHLFRGAAFQMPNPPGPGAALPPGTVALAITAEQLAHLDFLRVRDSRDPQFRGMATVEGNINARSDLHVAQYVHLGAQEELHSPCSADTAIARDKNGGLLVCRENVWRSSSRTGGGGYSVNLLYGCLTRAGGSTANPVTGTCGCPSGSNPVLISDSGPQAFPEGRTVGYLCVD
ncbi:hypothetical protein CR155_05385 [Pollutimonas nitritireducens]|uniref:Uncharacterized protein n=2 Tax=Pollutimonas nitritireducens TaxID=2045209 RepID=A0A2N4UIN3_9BURK|nr:hypothetical protein CR155_05385 [Pollutimonas nitritireducens]